MLWPFCQLSNLNGPVPTGWSPYASPHFSTAVGDTIDTGNIARFARNGAYGRSIVICTVSSSIFSTFSMFLNEFGQYWKSARWYGCWGSRWRSNENTTASALNGVPSWNFTPCASSNVHTFPLSSTLQLV